MMLQLSGLLAYILPQLYEMGTSICDGFDAMREACWCRCCFTPPRINVDAALEGCVSLVVLCKHLSNASPEYVALVHCSL